MCWVGWLLVVVLPLCGVFWAVLLVFVGWLLVVVGGPLLLACGGGLI